MKEVPRRFMPYLKEGEKLLWSGQPKQGIRLRDADVIILPVSLILTGFASSLFWILRLNQASLLLQGLSLLFALAGIYFGAIRLWLAARRRKYTYYAATNLRVLTLNGPGKKLKTLPLRNIERLDVSEERDGSGFIVFGNTNPLWPWLLGNFYMAGNDIPGFVMLPDVHRVYRLLLDQIRIKIPPALRDEIERAPESPRN